MALWCNSCGKDVEPTATLSESAQVIQACPTCQSRLGDALTPPMAAVGVAVGAEPVRTLPVRPRVVPIRPDQTSGPLPAPAGPSAVDVTDPIGAITRRLAWLDGEIAKAKGYEAEAKYLRKMLAAGRPRGKSSARPKRKPKPEASTS